MPKGKKNLCVDNLRHAEYYDMQGAMIMKRTVPIRSYLVSLRIGRLKCQNKSAINHMREV